jgi:hypothetical protein
MNLRIKAQALSGGFSKEEEDRKKQFFFFHHPFFFPARSILWGHGLLEPVSKRP